jgi:flagellar hook-basal body complex protein FliE
MAIDKIANPAQVANLYSSTQKAAEGGGMDIAGGPSFGELLRAGLGNAIDTIKGADRASAAAVMGKADMNDVVQSITKAELTLQTIVAVRDRLIGAYQDILRMPI